MSEAPPALPSTWEELLDGSGHVGHPELDALLATAAATQVQRYEDQVSETPFLTRSTALWVLGRMGGEAGRLLADTGLDLGLLSKQLTVAEISQPATVDRDQILLHPDLADALQAYLVSAGHQWPITEADLALAILRSAYEDPKRGLLPERLAAIGFLPAAAEERLVGKLTSADRGDDPIGLDPEQFSATMRSVRDTLEPWHQRTAAEIVRAIQSRHPEYGDNTFTEIVVRPDQGVRRATDQWLAAVSDGYDLDQLATTSHQVVDGRLALLALAQLDPELGADLDANGFLTRLRSEVEVEPRASSTSTADGPKSQPELLFPVTPDLVAEGQVIRASDDKLDIEDDVRSLCRLIAASNTRPPLAIGLFGDWGTGKSFFMRRMQTRMNELRTETQATLNQGNPSPYCEHVVQIPFNAWHFVDADLWASLMTRILDSLVAADDQRHLGQLLGQLESARQVRAEADARLAAATNQRAVVAERTAKLTDALSALDEESLTLGAARRVLAAAGTELVDTVPGLDDNTTDTLDRLGSDDERIATLRKLVSDTRSTGGLAVTVWRQMSRLARAGAVLVPLLGLIVVALFAAGLPVGGVIGLALTFGAAAGPAWSYGKKAGQVLDYSGSAGRLVAALDDRRSLLARHRLALDEMVAVRHAELGAAEAAVEEARYDSLLRQYIRQRVGDGAYREQLGIISIVRRDLEILSDLLTDGAVVGPGPMPHRPVETERIVLYIDDLDRCPPSRVVEVLQAVHLLLAFPLFVVVVGVDSRWLLTSLETHYRQLLGRDDGTDGLDEWSATPADYLEKIFQISLALRPMTDRSYRQLLGGLTGTAPRVGSGSAGPNGDSLKSNAKGRNNAPADGDRSESEGTNGGDGADRSVTEPSRSGLSDDTEEIELPVAASVDSFGIDGDIIHLGFGPRGRQLIAATTNGVWEWRSGQVRMLHVGPVDGVAVGSDASEVAWWTGDRIVIRDLAAGTETTVELDPAANGDSRPAVSRLALGPRSGEFVVCYADGTVSQFGGGEQVASSHIEGPVAMIGQLSLLLAGKTGTAYRLPSLTPAGWELPSRWDHYLVGYPIDVLYTAARSVVGAFQLSDSGAEQLGQVEVDTDDDIKLLAAPPGSLWFAAGTELYRWMPADNDGLRHVGSMAKWPRAAAQAGADLVLTYDGVGRTVVVEGGSPTSKLPPVAVSAGAVSATGVLIATTDGDDVHLWRRADVTAPEAPDQLDLDPDELDILASLAQLVPTARAAKRLVNTYRLLRASEIGRQRLTDSGTGDRQAALALLATVIGQPELGARLLDEIEGDDVQQWETFLQNRREAAFRATERDTGTRSRGPGRHTTDWGELMTALLALGHFPAERSTYAEWVPYVRRFSMVRSSGR